MSSGEADELGRILASGGEQSLGLAYFHSYPPDRIASMFAVKFAGLSDSERDSLEALARDGVAAGERITERGPSGTLNPDDIPTNPFLYGDDPEGNRVRIIGVVEFPETGALIRVYEDFEDLPGIADMFAALKEKAGGIGEAYPKKFGLTPGEPIEARVVWIALAEKRF
jgi:hypothetical protein